MSSSNPILSYLKSNPKHVVAGLAALYAVRTTIKAISQSKYVIDVDKFPKEKVEMIIQELNTAYTPYFNHAHIQLVNLKIQFGSSQQALQKSLHTKIEKKLLEQIDEIQTDVLQEKYHIPNIDAFKTLV